MSTIARLLLTSTAIAPVLLVFSILGFWEKEYLIAISLIAVCAFMTLICVGLIAYSKQNLERSKFRIISAEAADRENMAFVFLYLMPLFTSSFAALNWHLWVAAFVVIVALTATGYHYHFNPLLGLMGWHFYKVGTSEGITYVLLTKKQIRNVHGSFQTVQLTEYILMDIGDKK